MTPKDKTYQPCDFLTQELAEALESESERALGIELSGGGWSALADAIESDEWDSAAECEKRATGGMRVGLGHCAKNERCERQNHHHGPCREPKIESGSGGSGNAAPSAPAKQPQIPAVEAARSKAQAVAHALTVQAEGSLPDSLLPRLAPPVHFDALPTLHATTAAVSRSKLAERDEDGEYVTWHRSFDLYRHGEGMRAWCDAHGTSHCAPSVAELRELLDWLDPQTQCDAEVGEDYSRAARED